MRAGSWRLPKSGSGGMVKRLHLGRAAESGVIAARLAQRGYEGPRTVLEGRYGVLDAFCDEQRPDAADQGARARVRDRTHLLQALSLSRHRACAGAAPAQPHRRARLRRRRHPHASRSRHRARSYRTTASVTPADIMLAQYSVPFCVAIAALPRPARPQRVLRPHPARRARARPGGAHPAVGERGDLGLGRAHQRDAQRRAHIRRPDRHLARLPGDAAGDRAVARSSSTG